jgi:hypothetical protein
MPINMTFIPANQPAGLLALEDIPEDVKDAVDEAYEAIRSNDGRLRVEFPTKEEAQMFCRQAASYATQRPEGALKFRKSPTRKLPDNMVDFRITADLEAQGEANAQKGPND